MNPLAATIQTTELRDPWDQSRLVINSAFADLLASAGLITFHDFFHYDGGELIKRIPDRTVTRITLGPGEGFFLKRHLLEPHLPGFRHPSHSSEGALEFDHYCLFRRQGLATAIPVAMGERVVEGGGGSESFVLTRDFAPLISLEDIIRNTPHLLAGPGHAPLRHWLLTAAGRYARQMHQSGLNHLDYNATHILVNRDAGPKDEEIAVAVFDLQRVATNRLTSWRWPIKTLAELNFTLPEELFSNEERLSLLTTYLGRTELTWFDRLLWRWIQAKTATIGRHTVKRRARRAREREAMAEKREGGGQILIHDPDLGHEEPVSVETLLRKVPGAREVWAGQFRSRPVIVKIFESWRGGGQLARERQGLLTLRERGIPAPMPLLHGEDARGRQVLVMERIKQALSAAEVPALHAPGPEGQRVRNLLIRALAQQHQAGVEQLDLHLGNFLVQGDRVLTIDPGEIRFRSSPLGLRSSLAHLAAMGALLPGLGLEEFREMALAYVRAREWGLSEPIWGRLVRKRAAIMKAKLAQRLRKYGRPNTRHRQEVGRHYRLLIDRKSDLHCETPDELAAALREAYSGQTALRADEAVAFSWGGKSWGAYRIEEGSVVHRLRGAAIPGVGKAMERWQDLYRQQALNHAGPIPVALLRPRSPWPGLASFVIILPLP